MDSFAYRANRNQSHVVSASACLNKFKMFPKGLIQQGFKGRVSDWQRFLFNWRTEELLFDSEFQKQHQLAKDNKPRNKTSKSMDLGECTYTHTYHFQYINYWMGTNTQTIFLFQSSHPYMCNHGPWQHTYEHSRDHTLLSVHFFVVIHSPHPLSTAWRDLTLWSHKPWGLFSGLHECTIWWMCVCAYIRCVWINGRRRVSNLVACLMCG